MDEKIIVQRPWGHFELFTQNIVCSVKIHYINPDGEWSLQYHHEREEFYKILEGEAIVTLGEKKIDAKAGDEFFIPKLTKHKVQAKGVPVKLLEILFGHFDEDDEVRLEDKYGRTSPKKNKK